MSTSSSSPKPAPEPLGRERSLLGRRASRRDVLRAGAILGAVASLPAWARTARADPARADKVLVVLQLSGGNDGLSTLAPTGQDALYRLRSTTAIAAKEALPVAGGLGLHPNLDAWKRLFDAGHLAIVPGAGYPHPNRSHFQSMDIWQTASEKGRRVPTGWLGRALDHGLGEDAGPEAAVAVGGTRPYALEARTRSAVTLSTPEAYRWTGPASEQALFARMQSPGTKEGTAAWVAATADRAVASSSRVRSAVASYRPKASYPERSQLAKDLSIVAALLAGGIPTRVFTVQTGGFDTHTQQRVRHDRLMRTIGDAVGAFFQDVEAQGLGDRVSLLTFSEFGRRVAENSSGGTDHGTAAPVFVFGRGVRGGVHADQPRLDDLDGNGDLKMSVDFRRVYAAALDRWLGIRSTDVLGPGFPPLDVFV